MKVNIGDCVTLTKITPGSYVNPPDIGDSFEVIDEDKSAPGRIIARLLCTDDRYSLLEDDLEVTHRNAYIRPYVWGTPGPISAANTSTLVPEVQVIPEHNFTPTENCPYQDYNSKYNLEEP